MSVGLTAAEAWLSSYGKYVIQLSKRLVSGVADAEFPIEIGEVIWGP